MVSLLSAKDLTIDFTSSVAIKFGFISKLISICSGWFELHVGSTVFSLWSIDELFDSYRLVSSIFPLLRLSFVQLFILLLSIVVLIKFKLESSLSILQKAIFCLSI